MLCCLWQQRSPVAQLKSAQDNFALGKQSLFGSNMFHGFPTGALRGSSHAGAFVGPDGKSLPVPEGLPNAHMRLFGGAQYHRAMAEFRASIGELTCPDISREEIVNACGVDDFHDGVNYTRTACVIAVSKARDIFEPFLHQVGPVTPATSTDGLMPRASSQSSDA